MAKFKTIPPQGTRKIILPIIGLTSFENGVFEATQEQYEELSKLDFGFKVLPFDAKVKEPELDASKGEDEPKDQSTENGSDGQSISIESLSSLRVKDLDEIADSLLESQIITEQEHKDYLNFKKSERVEFIFQASNR